MYNNNNNHDEHNNNNDDDDNNNDNNNNTLNKKNANACEAPGASCRNIHIQKCAQPLQNSRTTQKYKINIQTYTAHTQKYKTYSKSEQNIYKNTATYANKHNKDKTPIKIRKHTQNIYTHIQHIQTNMQSTHKQHTNVYKK